MKVYRNETYSTKQCKIEHSQSRNWMKRIEKKCQRYKKKSGNVSSLLMNNQKVTCKIIWDRKMRKSEQDKSSMQCNAENAAEGHTARTQK